VEIIVVDDGSTDDTLEWLAGQKDIITLHQKHLGKCWAVNKAFTAASGKYIRFLDSDDKLAPMANDEQFEIAEAALADVVVSGYRTFTDDNTIVKEQGWIETDDFVAQQLGECDSSHYSAYLFRKDFIAEIPHRPDFALRDDRLFVLEVALNNPKVAIHKGMALLHRVAHHDRLQQPGGLERSVQNYQHLNIYRLILGQLREQGQLTPRRADAAIKALWPLARWMARDSIRDAKKLVDWIYDLDPNFEIPEGGTHGWLYRSIGFTGTEKTLRLCRSIVNVFR